MNTSTDDLPPRSVEAPLLHAHAEAPPAPRGFALLRAVARRARGAARRLILRLRVGTADFTIISNNCWGSHVYQSMGAPYATPFIGLFLTPTCYLKLLSDFRANMQQPLTFCAESRYDWVNAFRQKHNHTYPIGLLAGDIEIHFLHYESQDEAVDKWTRRVARMNPSDDRLFIKLCDHDQTTPDQVAAFDRLPFRNKVCFLARSAPQLKSVVTISGLSEDRVPDGLQLSYISPRFFDAGGWIRGSNPRSWWRVFRCA